jgi:hypothetical protein
MLFQTPSRRNRSMIRVALATLTLAIAAAVSAAPVPPGADQVRLLYPTAVGTKWTYAAGDQTVVVEITESARQDGETRVVMVTRVNDKDIASEVMAVGAGGVSRVQVKDAKVDPPVLLLPPAPKAGTEWALKSAVGAQTIEGTSRVVGPEKVEAPAGTYDAIRVDTTARVAGAQTTIRTWYAPNVGVVQLEYDILGTVSTLKLKAFAPGK